MSTWIEMLPVESATGSLKEAYDLAKTPAGTVDNVMRIHSLRPHTMVGHLKLYRSVLHHQENTLPLWFLEAVGVFTSLLNNCEYSFTHHSTNLRRLLNDDERFGIIENALRCHTLDAAFSGKELALMRYTKNLPYLRVKLKQQTLKTLNLKEQLKGKFWKSTRSAHTSATLTAPSMVLV